MYLLFIEYPVKPSVKQSYIRLTSQLRELAYRVGAEQYTLAESVEQSHLFVESITIPQMEMSQSIQQHHTNIIERYVEGGKAKVKYWLFHIESHDGMVAE